MKKIFTIIIFLSALTSNAQQSNFRGHNNYVVPPLPSEILKTGLVMNLDAGDLLSYSGSGNTWTNLTRNRITANPTLENYKAVKSRFVL